MTTETEAPLANALLQSDREELKLASRKRGETNHRRLQSDREELKYLVHAEGQEAVPSFNRTGRN